MKKVFLKGLIIASALLVFVSCKKEAPAAVAVVDTNKIKEEIQAKENEFADVYNSGVMKNIGYFADDAISFLQNNQPISGKEKIIEYLKSQSVNNSNGAKISFTTSEVFVSNDGEQVVEIGNYQIVDSTNVGINSGNYMTLFKKINGKYYSLRDMSASDIK